MDKLESNLVGGLPSLISMEKSCIKKLIKRMTILLLLLSLGISVSSYCEVPGGHERLFEETYRYALIVPDPTSNENLIPISYVVRFDSIQHNYTLLDSIYSRSISAADSNVIVYVDIGEEYTYLVALSLSPTIDRDTLLMMKNDDPSNWLNSGPRMLFALTDSILVLPKRISLNLGVEIIRILPNFNWEVKLTIPNIRSVSMAHDFTQVLMCLDSNFNNKFSVGSVIVYDLALDTIYELSELGDSNYVAKRRSRESQTFVLEKRNRQTAIWAYPKEGKPIKITDNEANEMITTFSLYYNRLFLIMKDDSNPSRVRYPTRNIYD